MAEPRWSLRASRQADRDFLFALNETTMRESVERVWGWDHEAQVAFFDNRFQPERWQVIQCDSQDIGVLIVSEDEDEIYVAEIQIAPEWQGRGIGSSIIRSLMESASQAGKSLSLRVLHVNGRARALYERLGFEPFKEIETHTYLRWGDRQEQSGALTEVSPVAYDRVADAYRRTLDPDGEGLVDQVLTDLLDDVSGQVVLSLACGQGQDARLLARLGATVTAIDISAEMLRYANDHEAANPRGITYLHGDAQRLEGLADAGFDGVLCHMALIDIPELAPTIQSAARVLRSGGWFVFSIVHPAYHPHVQILDDYLLDHAYSKKPPLDWLPGHAYHRPLAAYVNELVQAGFRIERLIENHMQDRAERDSGGVPGLLYVRVIKS